MGSIRSQIGRLWAHLNPFCVKFGATVGPYIHVHTPQSMLYSICVPRSVLHSPYLHSTWNSLAQANTATAIPDVVIARCPSRIDYCILPIAHCLLHQPAAHNLLPIASFRRSGPAECAERLNPPPLPLGNSWRVKSKAEVQ